MDQEPWNAVLRPPRIAFACGRCPGASTRPAGDDDDPTLIDETASFRQTDGGAAYAPRQACEVENAGKLTAAAFIAPYPPRRRGEGGCRRAITWRPDIFLRCRGLGRMSRRNGCTVRILQGARGAYGRNGNHRRKTGARIRSWECTCHAGRSEPPPDGYAISVTMMINTGNVRARRPRQKILPSKTNVGAKASRRTDIRQHHSSLLSGWLRERRPCKVKSPL